MLECKQLHAHTLVQELGLRVVLLESDHIYTLNAPPYTLTLLDIDFTAVTESN